MRRLLAVGVLLALALAACAEPTVPRDEPEPAPEPVPAPVDPDEPDVPDGPQAPEDPGEPGPPPSDFLEDAVAAAVADAAERAAVAEEEVVVVTTEQVTWRDGALGCPQPGEAYTQALVEGYRIVVEADGRRLHYHGADGRAPRYCERPQDPL